MRRFNRNQKCYKSHILLFSPCYRKTLFQDFYFALDHSMFNSLILAKYGRLNIKGRLIVLYWLPESPIVQIYTSRRHDVYPVACKAHRKSRTVVVGGPRRGATTRDVTSPWGQLVTCHVTRVGAEMQLTLTVAQTLTYPLAATHKPTREEPNQPN